MIFPKNIIPLSIALASPSFLKADDWTVDSQKAWEENKAEGVNIEIKTATLSPSKESGTYKSVIKSFANKRSADSITISQVPTWLNWEPSKQLGPKNLQDAPVTLRAGEGDYWVFGRYGKSKNSIKGKEAKLKGFDIPLKTTSLPNVFDAPGAAEKSLGGYHAWQSKDMKNWVHHGPVSDKKARWMTTAERVGNKTYFYYDFPNDQDPHLIIDDNLTDGKMGQQMGMAFKDPSHGSDCAIIRSLDGKFHLILENWDPINASKRSWDSPLASHAISEDGIKDFKLTDPAVDYRTTPTGKMSSFRHPHWAKEDPTNYPGEVAPEGATGNGVKVGQKYSTAEFEIHQPEQEAYGDWAAIAIGEQYYLFGDYDPVGAHGKDHMKTVWFTSNDINKPFEKCSTIGKGHPDPDIIFAEGQFYLFSQTDDFVSDGPWVDGVEVRVGVDIDNDKKIDQWTDWTNVKETYSGVKGFAKQVAKTPAPLYLSSLPKGHGFQYEIRLKDTTKNQSKPTLDKVVLSFGK